MTEEKKISTVPWYSLTPNRLLATLGSLKGEINCDVCVIGGGFTGISAALELSQNGYSVILIESKNIAAAASGRNAGHLLRGYSLPPSSLIKKTGKDTAKMLSDMTLEAQTFVTDRISKHEIKCDLTFGHVTAALKPGHVKTLKKTIAAWEALGQTDLKYLDQKETQEHVKSSKYIGGLFDPKGAHLHPLNYALGIAQAAQKAGCRIYDETPVLSIKNSATKAKITTEKGIVNAEFVILGGSVSFPGMSKLRRRIFAATAPTIATAPLDKTLAGSLLPKNSAVADANSLMDYFSLSSDNRLLFGGTYLYGAVNLPQQAEILRQKMVKIFPELSETRIEHCWGGLIDITLNRMPHFGCLAPNIFYAQGYCGHGLVLSNMAGKMIADAMMGSVEKFDIFARIKHMPVFGGDVVKQPLFELGVLWLKLKDLL